MALTGERLHVLLVEGGVAQRLAIGDILGLCNVWCTVFEKPSQAVDFLELHWSKPFEPYCPEASRTLGGKQSLLIGTEGGLGGFCNGRSLTACRPSLVSFTGAGATSLSLQNKATDSFTTANTRLDDRGQQLGSGSLPGQHERWHGVTACSCGIDQSLCPSGCERASAACQALRMRLVRAPLDDVHLVICDISFSDDKEVLQLLAFTRTNRRQHTPIVLLACPEEPEERVARLLLAGAICCIRTPFTIRDAASLLSLVKSLSEKGDFTQRGRSFISEDDRKTVLPECSVRYDDQKDWLEHVYEQLGIIGTGATSTIYLVRRLSDSKLLALKEISLGLFPPQERAMTINEVAIMRHLESPPMIGFAESWLEGDNLKIIMEYAGGGNLHDVIQNYRGMGKSIPFSLITKWTASLAVGLQVLHEHKIIHRDLKGQNVLLTTSGDIRICDFGASKLLTARTMLAKTAVGTPFFMSPEASSGKRYGTPSDLWALGVLLYEMLHLRRPFDGTNLQALFQAIQSSEPAWHSYTTCDGFCTTDNDLLGNCKSFSSSTCPPFTSSSPSQHTFLRGASDAPSEWREYTPLRGRKMQLPTCEASTHVTVNRVFAYAKHGIHVFGEQKDPEQEQREQKCCSFLASTHRQQFQELVKRLLTKEPTDRPSALDLCCHPLLILDVCRLLKGRDAPQTAPLRKKIVAYFGKGQYHWPCNMRTLCQSTPSNVFSVNSIDTTELCRSVGTGSHDLEGFPSWRNAPTPTIAFEEKHLSSWSEDCAASKLASLNARDGAETRVGGLNTPPLSELRPPATPLPGVTRREDRPAWSLCASSPALLCTPTCKDSRQDLYLAARGRSMRHFICGNVDSTNSAFLREGKMHLHSATSCNFASGANKTSSAVTTEVMPITGSKSSPSHAQQHRNRISLIGVPGEAGRAVEGKESLVLSAFGAQPPRRCAGMLSNEQQHKDENNWQNHEDWRGPCFDLRNEDSKSCSSLGRVLQHSHLDEQSFLDEEARRLVIAHSGCLPTLQALAHLTHRCTRKRPIVRTPQPSSSFGQRFVTALAACAAAATTGATVSGSAVLVVMFADLSEGQAISSVGLVLAAVLLSALLWTAAFEAGSEQLEQLSEFIEVHPAAEALGWLERLLRISREAASAILQDMIDMHYFEGLSVEKAWRISGSCSLGVWARQSCKALMELMCFRSPKKHMTEYQWLYTTAANRLRQLKYDALLSGASSTPPESTASPLSAAQVAVLEFEEGPEPREQQNRRPPSCGHARVAQVTENLLYVLYLTHHASFFKISLALVRAYSGMVSGALPSQGSPGNCCTMCSCTAFETPPELLNTDLSAIRSSIDFQEFESKLTSLAGLVIARLTEMPAYERLAFAMNMTQLLQRHAFVLDVASALKTGNSVRSNDALKLFESEGSWRQVWLVLAPGWWFAAPLGWQIATVVIFFSCMARFCWRRYASSAEANTQAECPGCFASRWFFSRSTICGQDFSGAVLSKNLRTLCSTQAFAWRTGDARALCFLLGGSCGFFPLLAFDAHIDVQLSRFVRDYLTLHVHVRRGEIELPAFLSWCTHLFATSERTGSVKSTESVALRLGFREGSGLPTTSPTNPLGQPLKACIIPYGTKSIGDMAQQSKSSGDLVQSATSLEGVEKDRDFRRLSKKSCKRHAAETACLLEDTVSGLTGNPSGFARQAMSFIGHTEPWHQDLQGATPTKLVKRRAASTRSSISKEPHAYLVNFSERVSLRIPRCTASLGSLPEGLQKQFDPQRAHSKQNCFSAPHRDRERAWQAYDLDGRQHQQHEQHTAEIKRTNGKPRDSFLAALWMRQQRRETSPAAPKTHADPSIQSNLVKDTTVELLAEAARPEAALKIISSTTPCATDKSGSPHFLSHGGCISSACQILGNRSDDQGLHLFTGEREGFFSASIRRKVPGRDRWKLREAPPNASATASHEQCWKCSQDYGALAGAQRHWNGKLGARGETGTLFDKSFRRVSFFSWVLCSSNGHEGSFEAPERLKFLAWLMQHSRIDLAAASELAEETLQGRAEWRLVVIPPAPTGTACFNGGLTEPLQPSAAEKQ
ncbi:hypothetical protein Efla_003159 [Eimeria flavescens]